MARHSLDPDVPSMITDEPSVGPEPVDRLTSILRLVVRKVNGLLSFGSGEHGTQAGNIHGQWMTYVTPSGPGTEADIPFAVPHGLGRVPTAVFAGITQDTNVTSGDFGSGSLPPRLIGVAVYADSSHAWTEELVWLKCNTPNAKLALLIV